MPADRPPSGDSEDAGLPRRPGDIVGDRYRVVRVLARGGVGVVFEAEHTFIERRVALKMLLPRLAGGEAQVQRFIREAKAAAQLSHPHVVDVVDMGRDPRDGALFLVQSLLISEDLEQRLERAARIPPGQLVDLLLPILDALRFAHERGVLHRDLKPSNIFLVAAPGGGFVPKLIDFGAIKRMDGADDWLKLTQAGAFVGTPIYMSPEQIRGEALDARADIWSLGVIMHRALTGELPFETASVARLFDLILTSRAPRIDDPRVPPHLAAVVHRALAPAREDRFPSVAALIEAITAPAAEARRSTPPESEERTIIDDTLQTHLQKASRREWPVVLAPRPALIPPVSGDLTNVPAENERVEDSFDDSVPEETATFEHARVRSPTMRVVAEPTPTPAPHAVRRPVVLAGPSRRAARTTWKKPVRMGLTSAPRGADDELLRGVEKALGDNWTLQRFASYSNLVDALCEDDIELAWLPPVAYLRARKLGPVHLLLALARGGRASYGSAIIASERAGISSLPDVRGKRVVWVDVWSAAGYLMPRGVLRDAGLDPAQVFASQSFVGSHGAVLDALEAGRADLGATYCTLDDDGALVAAPWTDRPSLRPIALSGAIPGDAICAAGELSLKDAEAIVEPLLTLSTDPAGASLLRKLFGTERFAEVDGSYYQALEGV